MDKKQLLEFATERFTEEMEKLSHITGVRSCAVVLKDIRETDAFYHRITVLYNNNFEVAFNTEESKMEFKTTYSNQTIDNEYMSEMLTINNSLRVLESHIKNIIHILDQPAF